MRATLLLHDAIKQSHSREGIMVKKLCKELSSGDQLELKTGVIKTVHSVTRGMISSHNMINFTDGDWVHAVPNLEIELAN